MENRNQIKNAGKKVYRLFILLPLFFAIALNAQETGFGYGGILGIGQANIRTDGLSSPQPKISFTGGVTTSYKFNKNLGLGLDITGVTKGAKVSGSEKAGFPSQTYNYQETYTMLDLDIPVVLRAYIGSDNLNLNIMGGAGMNFNLLAFSSRVYEDASYDADNGYRERALTGINTTNLSYTFGLGLTAKAGSGDYYFIQAKTNGPLSSMGRINGSDATHNSLTITFGYLFY